MTIATQASVSYPDRGPSRSPTRATRKSANTSCLRAARLTSRCTCTTGQYNHEPSGALATGSTAGSCTRIVAAGCPGCTCASMAPMVKRPYGSGKHHSEGLVARGVTGIMGFGLVPEDRAAVHVEALAGYVAGTL